MAIKNILFDLGGVLLNIDYGLTEKAFVELGLSDFPNIYSQARQSGLFDDFEMGKISEKNFFDKIGDIFNERPADEEIKHAWNAMLLDFPAHRLDMLKKLSRDRRIFLISNTNAIHYDALNASFVDVYGHKLGDYFEKDYYSHILGMRKPNREVFEYITNECEIKPEETIFIDDSLQHIEGARKLHFQAHLLPAGKDVGNLLRGLSILA